MVHNLTLVLGAQWGDEGKGKIVDLLASEADIICRCQGGNNSDHTIVVNGTEYIFHLLPSGITNPKCICVIGNGVVIHLPGLFDELKSNTNKGLINCEERLIISDRAHLVFDFHQDIDTLQELKKEKKIGTTKRGIGPTYTAKIARIGIRIGDLVGDFSKFTEIFQDAVAIHQQMFPELKVNVSNELTRYRKYAEEIKKCVKNTVCFLNKSLDDGKKVIVEGANAAMLDVDFGTYPYVTSSNCSAGGVCTGLGIPPTKIDEIIGVVKAYTTKVGEGPFPTALINECEELRTRGNEIGRTTYRVRTCGWLDLVALKHSNMINGYTKLALTKLDILDTLPEIKLGIAYRIGGEVLKDFPSTISDLQKVEVEYLKMPGWNTSIENVRTFEDLPDNAKKYVKKIEEIINVPVKWIGVGKSREAIIIVN